VSTRTILIRTDAAGAFTYERPMFGTISMIETVVDELDTPNIVISSVEDGAVLRTLTALATDDWYQPSSPLAVFGTLRVAVTGGGDTKTGRVRMVVQT